MLKVLKTIRPTILATLISGLALTSCNDSIIFDYEGDCSVVYKVNFKYDLNMKWADAFSNEVKSVRLYAFNEDGILVREYDESGEKLAADNYMVTLDLNPGKYRLLAWCGIDNPGANQHFNVPEAKVGQTTIDQLTCRLHRYEDEIYSSVCDDRLEFMFHGLISAELTDNDEEGEYLYTIPLTKDTNHLRIVLQHLSGKDLDVSQFSFRIEDANGHYAHDNTILEDEIITYKAYNKTSGEATIIKDENTRASIIAKTAVADLSLARLMADRNNKMVLTITNSEGKDIAKVPIIDYALLTKDYYEDAYNHKMTDQEFLDREDEYTMTFFIDENNEWYSAEIYINSWRVVLRDYEI